MVKSLNLIASCVSPYNARVASLSLVALETEAGSGLAWPAAPPGMVMLDAMAAVDGLSGEQTDTWRIFGYKCKHPPNMPSL